MKNLTSIELQKIFKRGRSYIGFLALALIVLVIEFGMFIDGQELLDFLIQSLSERFQFYGQLINAYTVFYIILNSLWIHVPILIAIVVGDLLSGEAQGGTFRVLLTRPVSRTRLVVAKWLAAQLYVLALVGFMGVFSLGIGYVIFGAGDMIVLFNTINIFEADDILWRFAFASAFGVLSMWVVSALAMFFSSMSSNSLGPVVATLSVVIAFTIITNFSLGIFDVVKPFLFTSYLNAWQLFFDYPVDYGLVLQSALILLGHIGGLFLLTILIFRNKDITS